MLLSACSGTGGSRVLVLSPCSCSPSCRGAGRGGHPDCRGPHRSAGRGDTAADCTGKLLTVHLYVSLCMYLIGVGGCCHVLPSPDLVLCMLLQLGGYDLVLPPPPSSAAVVAFCLKFLAGYGNTVLGPLSANSSSSSVSDKRMSFGVHSDQDGGLGLQRLVSEDMGGERGDARWLCGHHTTLHLHAVGFADTVSTGMPLSRGKTSGGCRLA